MQIPARALSPTLDMSRRPEWWEVAQWADAQRRAATGTDDRTPPEATPEPATVLSSSPPRDDEP